MRRFRAKVKANPELLIKQREKEKAQREKVKTQKMVKKLGEEAEEKIMWKHPWDGVACDGVASRLELYLAK